MAKSAHILDPNEAIDYRYVRGVYNFKFWLSHTAGITRIYYFGHAGINKKDNGVGELYLGDLRYSDRDLKLMEVSQLPNGINMHNLKEIYLFGCHTGDKGNYRISIAQAFANYYRVPVEGVNGKLSLGRSIATWKGNSLIDIRPGLLRPTEGISIFYPNGKKPEMERLGLPCLFEERIYE